MALEAAPRPRCLGRAHWPAGDRAAWEQALLPRNPFRRRTPAPRWRPATFLKAGKSYGVWLAFLMTRDDWDPMEAPGARVTRARLRAFYGFLRDAGNRPLTITSRFDDLARVLRLLAPGQDWAWVRRPDGQAIRTLQPQTPQPKKPPPDTAVLAAWACELMDAARAGPDEMASWLRYRDGLILALLAWRARRLAAMAQLRPGEELRRQPAGYRIALTAEQVKTGKPDAFDLPVALTGYIRHYLAVVRPALLAGRAETALWISRDGRALAAKTLAETVRKWTRRRFGEGFGPHRFRHALSTTATLSAPDHPGLAASLLGISAAVVERHYNLAGQVAVTTRFATQIAAKRQHYAAAQPPHPPPAADGQAAEDSGG